MEHIYNYQNYNNSINEKVNWDKVANLALGLSMAWTSHTMYNKYYGDTTIGQYDVKQYAIENSVNDNKLITNSVNIVKNMVINNDNLINKDEILTAIDSVLILFNKKDKISNALLSSSTKKSKDNQLYGLTMWFNDLEYPIIMISKIDQSVIIHELNHVVDYYSDLDISKLPELFDFDISDDEQKRRFVKIFGITPNMKNRTYRELPYLINNSMKEYLKEPTELNVRLKHLKLFLYEQGYLNTPTDNLTHDIMMGLYNGEIYNNLDKNGKFKFLRSDMLQILPFLKVYKYKDIDKYADIMINKEKKYI